MLLKISIVLALFVLQANGYGVPLDHDQFADHLNQEFKKQSPIWSNIASHWFPNFYKNERSNNEFMAPVAPKKPSMASWFEPKTPIFKYIPTIVMIDGRFIKQMRKVQDVPFNAFGGKK